MFVSTSPVHPQAFEVFREGWFQGKLKVDIPGEAGVRPKTSTPREFAKVAIMRTTSVIVCWSLGLQGRTSFSHVISQIRVVAQTSHHCTRRICGPQIRNRPGCTNYERSSQSENLLAKHAKSFDIYYLAIKKSDQAINRHCRSFP